VRMQSCSTSRCTMLTLALQLDLPSPNYMCASFNSSRDKKASSVSVYFICIRFDGAGRVQAPSQVGLDL
jgi:hypothetical protein